jgi:predicted DCC family thiol-disulfide oxidoreductase YuxK
LKIELYYDEECPFCNAYSNFIKIKENHQLTLHNVRECKREIENFNLLGFNINDGFIVRIDKTNIYQGVDAIVVLNDLSKNKFYFPDNYFFRNIVYPTVKYLRKLILFIRLKKVDI